MHQYVGLLMKDAQLSEENCCISKHSTINNLDVAWIKIENCMYVLKHEVWFLLIISPGCPLRMIKFWLKLMGELPLNEMTYIPVYFANELLYSD